MLLRLTKLTVNSVVLFFIILFSWHTVIQNGHREAQKVRSKFKEGESTDEGSV